MDYEKINRFPKNSVYLEAKKAYSDAEILKLLKAREISKEDARLFLHKVILTCKSFDFSTGIRLQLDDMSPIDERLTVDQFVDSILNKQSLSMSLDESHKICYMVTDKDPEGKLYIEIDVEGGSFDFIYLPISGEVIKGLYQLQEIIDRLELIDRLYIPSLKIDPMKGNWCPPLILPLIQQEQTCQDNFPHICADQVNGLQHSTQQQTQVRVESPRRGYENPCMVSQPPPLRVTPIPNKINIHQSALSEMKTVG